MLSLFFIILFLFGLEIGSFLNCIIYRLSTGGSFLKGRSFCPYCHHKLSWLDLIPVFSFLILKAKCRYCQKKISWQYPLVEIATGLLFVLISYQTFWQYDFLSLWLFNYLFLVIITCFLIIIFIYDLRHYLIPDKVIYPAIAVAFLYVSISNWLSGSLSFWLYSLGAGLGAAVFFLSIFLVSRGKWLGFGDVKLVFFLGLFLGWPNVLVALFSAFFIGALVGTSLIILRKKNLKSEVPFAPFLVVGTFIALFWGGLVLDWYLSLIIY